MAVALPLFHAGPNGGNAFQIALDKYLSKLKEEDRAAFMAAYKDLTADGLVASVNEVDKKHKLGSRFSPAISRTFDILEELMRSVSIAIQSNPEISSLVVGGARLVIDVAVKFISFFRKLADMIVQLSEYLQVLDTFVKRLEKDGASKSDKILKCVANVYINWLDFCREVRKIFKDRKGNIVRCVSIRVFLRVQWNPFESTFGAIKQSFQQNLELLLHSTAAVQYSDIKEILDKLNEASSAQQEIQAATTRRDFMHWISALDFDDDHERISSRKHPGTADWLIQRSDFQTWAKSNSSQLLWCYGKPGSGKSVLASHCLEHMTWRAASDSNIGIAFCYFNYKQAEHQTPRHILSTFIKQLCWGRSQLPDPIISFYRKHVLDARTPSYESIENALSAVADEYQELNLVVDALDECQQELREQILGSIVELSQSHRCVKCFITSRPENDIMHMFRRLSTPTICIKAQNTAEDIRKYVVDSVDKLIKDEKLRVEKAETAQIITDTLVDRADGMFLWVYLQLQSLCRQRSDRDILEELSNLPLGLYDTYYRVLSVIEALPEKLQALAQRCLTLVFFAARPLKMSELIDMAAVAAGFDDMQRLDMQRYKSEHILEACANLLIEDNGVVRPSHFSVQEYFSSTRSPLGEFAKYFMKPEEGHAQIATACLRYLSFHFLRGGICSTAYSYNARLQRYPCIRYAVLYFDYHIAALPKVPSDLRIRLEKFLSQPERSLSAAAQVRRDELDVRPRGETFAYLPWPANASTFIETTKIHLVEDIQSDHDCWYQTSPPCTLHAACWEGKVDVVAALVEKGYNLVERDSEGRTPLYYAATQGFPDVCRLFSSDVVNKDLEGYSMALRAAFHRRHEGVARVLVSMTSDKRTIQECLALAVYDGDMSMLRILLDTLQSRGPVDPDLLTLGFEMASFRQRFEAFQELFSVKTNKGHFNIGLALYWSCLRHNKEFAELLLGKGVDPSGLDLSVPCVITNGSLKASKALVGDRFNASGWSKDTYATSTGRMKLVDPSRTSIDKKAILSLATKMKEKTYAKSIETMELLAGRIYSNRLLFSPLLIAIVMRAYDVMDVLLQQGAPINQLEIGPVYDPMEIDEIELESLRTKFIIRQSETSSTYSESKGTTRSSHGYYIYTVDGDMLPEDTLLVNDDELLADDELLRSTIPTGCPSLDWMIEHPNSTSTRALDALRQYGAAPRLPGEFWQILNRRINIMPPSQIQGRIPTRSTSESPTDSEPSTPLVDVWPE